MTSLRQWAGGLLIACLGACASAGDKTGDDQVLGQSSQTLTVPGAIPVPCVPCAEDPTAFACPSGSTDTVHIWDGNQVQLMLADAYAQCGFQTHGDYDGLDDVLKDVVSKMYFTEFLADAGGDTIGDMWLGMRENPSRNCELAGDGRARAFPLSEREGVTWDDSWSDGTSETDAAHYDLRLGDLNLCIAQQMRDASPGASGGAALLLSADEQVQLLQIVKERAQIAMLQYATILGLSRGARQPGHYQRFDVIDSFLANLSLDQRNQFGVRLASAIQLSIQINQELASLLARSRSAHLAYTPAEGKAPQTDADWTWGPGSWQQRLAGSLFGADPGVQLKDGSRREFDFLKFPYVKSAAPRPQVWELLRLARSLDLVELNFKPGSDANCSQLDGSQQLIYDQVQLELQRQACPSTSGFDSATGKCSGADAVDVLSQRYSINRDDGIAINSQLVEALSPGISTSDNRIYPNNCGSNRRWGALNFRGTLTTLPTGGGVLPTKIHLSADFAFEPRDLVDHASLFSTVDGDEFTGEAPNVPTARSDELGPPEQGLLMLQSLTLAQKVYSKGYTTEQKRLAGGIDALVATRRVLQTLDDSGSAASKIWGSLNLQTLIGLVDAAVGPTGTVLRMPSTKGCADTKSRTPFLDCWGNPPADIRVELSGATDDPILAPPKTSMSGATDKVRLYVLPDDGWLQHLVADPGTSIDDRTLTYYLRYSLNTAQKDLLWNEDEHAWTTGVAGADYWVNDVNQYQPLLGNISLASALNGAVLVAVRINTNQNANFSLPNAATLTAQDLRTQARLVATRLRTSSSGMASGVYIGTGGTLGTLARRQLTPNMGMPGTVAYDGFDLPEGWVPPFSAELFGGNPGESSVTHFMASAKTASSAATQAVSDAMKALLDQETDLAAQKISSDQREAAIQAAQDRLNEALHQAKSSLCGQNTDCTKDLSLRVLDGLDPSWYPAMPASLNCVMAGTVSDAALAEAEGILNGTLPRPQDQNYYDWLQGRQDGIINDRLELNILIAQQSPSTLGMLRLTNGAMWLIGHAFGRTDFGSEEDRLAAAQKDAAGSIAAMRCFGAAVIHDFLAVQPKVPAVMLTALDSSATATPGLPVASGTVPNFEQFAGGSLQSALIEQFRAIKAPNERFDLLAKTIDAAAAKIDAANAILVKTGGDVVRNCSASAMSSAYAAGHSGGFPLSISWSPGPLIAQQQRCDEVTAAFGPAVKEATAQNKEAMASVTSATQGLIDAQAAILQSSATIEKLVNDAALAESNAKTEAAVETSLAAANNQVVSQTSFGLSRRLFDADLWRAKALVETARRDALIARRAIEAQFVVDMSQLGGDEAFVVAPHTWANEIYRYDLSLPSSVGLVVSSGTTNSAGDGIVAKSAVEDYVTNLESFVNGYAATRPSAIARDEIDVITLPGLALGEPTEVGVNNASGVQVETAVIHPSQGTWQVHCKGGEWVPLPAPPPPAAAGQDPPYLLDSACPSSKVDAARISFILSPWGQLDGDPRNTKFAARYNSRWTKLAVNLVGTGVVDCADALDVFDCYSRGSISYNLTHQGQPWVSDYYGAWRTLALPPGVVEGGKALALERWLEPLVDGWTTPYISAIARTEFEFRPLGGEYTLELKLPPEARPQYIDRVQILIGSQSWVAQSLGPK